MSGSDLLARLGLAQTGGSGFTPPLGPGTYTFLIQQTGPPLTGFTLAFVVVPEPSSAALLGAGLFRRARILSNRGHWPQPAA